MRAAILYFQPVKSSFRVLVNLLSSAADFGVSIADISLAESQCEQAEAIVYKALADQLPDFAVLCWAGEGEIVQRALAKIRDVASRTMPVLIAFDEPRSERICEVLRAGGVNDFVTAPFRAEDVLPRLWQMNETWSVREPLVQYLKERCGLTHFVGKSALLLAELQKLPAIAGCDLNVLILGETGTGKEIFAHAVHNLSPRLNKPFIPLNCGAVPVELLENELFGHEPGAYTSAASSRRGIIEEAAGGSVFLDEIECLQPVAQAKLLRFLQEKEFKPLGDPRIRHADVRIIAASNVDLDQAMVAGRFRRDLYYRLNVVSVRMPALRDRPEDIPLLARHFLASYSKRLAKPVRDLTAGALQKLALYDWPGNVRELKNTIERAVLFAQSPFLVEADLVLPRLEFSAASGSFKHCKSKAITAFEKAYLSEQLRAHAGNISQAARASQQHPRAFRRLVQKHQLKVQIRSNLGT